MDSTTAASDLAISVQDVQSEIEFVTRAHMGLEVKPERFLTSNHDGAGREMAIYLVQYYYKGFEDSIGEGAHFTLYERGLANAKMMALRQSVDVLPATVDQAKLFLLSDAEETKWYRHFEWDGIQDMLMTMFDDYKEGGSSYSDLKFFAEIIFPLARSAGVSRKEIIGATTQIKKMRAAVAPVRALLDWEKNGKVSKASTERAIRAILRGVANPKISIAKFEVRMARFRGKQIRRKEPLPGQIYILPRKTRIVIDVETPEDLRFVEVGLRGRVDLSLTDLQVYFDDVTDMLNLRTLRNIIDLREADFDGGVELEDIVKMLERIPIDE